MESEFHGWGLWLPVLLPAVSASLIFGFVSSLLPTLVTLKIEMTEKFENMLSRRAGKHALPVPRVCPCHIWLCHCSFRVAEASMLSWSKGRLNYKVIYVCICMVYTCICSGIDRV
jgi:hypothetical protein